MTRLTLAVGLLLAAPAGALEIKPHPIVTSKRLELTRAYCKAHYGLDSYALTAPKMIVIHFTAIKTLEGSFNAFEGDQIPGHRDYIKDFGDVNVGVHFLVDLDGTAYSLLPLDVVGRHAIGFNHVSIGIENVAGDAKALTARQLETDAALVKDLSKRFPSIRYLIGHHEYAKKDLPHYRLYKELDPKYHPTVKDDPGKEFMASLRAALAARGLRFKE